MFRSLRFRLPAFFLIGIVLSGVIAAAIAFGLFQSYVQDRTRSELQRNAAGLAQLYEKQAIRSQDENRPPVQLSARDLESTSGNRIYYVGGNAFLRGQTGLRHLPDSYFPDWRLGRAHSFDFVPPHRHETYLAYATPFKLDHQVWGALVVATPKDTLRSGWITLMQRLGIAFLIGAFVAGGSAGGSRAASRGRCSRSPMPRTRWRPATTTSTCRLRATTRSASCRSASRRWPGASARSRS